MFQILQNIREFIDLEKMKHSTDSLRAEIFLTIHRHEEDDQGVMRPVVHFFTHHGTYIGTIENPEV